MTVTAYQTIPSALAHLFRADPQWNPDPVADLPWLALSGALAAGVCLLAVTLWRAASHEHRLAGIAASVVLAVMFSPVAEQYHYLLIVPAIAVAVEAQGWRGADGGPRYTTDLRPRCACIAGGAPIVLAVAIQVGRPRTSGGRSVCVSSIDRGAGAVGTTRGPGTITSGEQRADFIGGRRTPLRRAVVCPACCPLAAVGCSRRVLRGHCRVESRQLCSRPRRRSADHVGVAQAGDERRAGLRSRHRPSRCGPSILPEFAGAELPSGHGLRGRGHRHLASSLAVACRRCRTHRVDDVVCVALVWLVGGDADRCDLDLLAVESIDTEPRPPLLALAQSGRYDLVVVALLWVTLLLLQACVVRPRRLTAILVGVCAGLTMLTQFYGIAAVILTATVYVMRWGRATWREPVPRWSALACLLVLVPYGVFVISISRHSRRRPLSRDRVCSFSTRDSG